MNILLSAISKLSRIDNLLTLQNGSAYLAKTAIFSLLSLYFVNILKFPLDTIAILLAYSAFVLRVSRILFSPMIDKISFKIALPASLLLCSLGCLGLGFVTSPLAVAIWILPVGIGFGVNSVLVKYAISELNDGNKETLLRFAKMSISINLGAALGPLVGNLSMLHGSQKGITFCAASIFFIGFICAYIISSRNEFHMVQQDWIKTICKYFADPQFRNYFIVSCMAWFLYSQLVSSTTLYIGRGLQAWELAGFIFLLNSLLIACLSMKLIKFITSFSEDDGKILAFSFFLYLLSFLTLSISPTLIGVFFSIIFTSLAEIFMLPSLNTILTKLTTANERIVSFTIIGITMGIGEGLGSFVGVSAIQLGEIHNMPHLSFMLLSLIAMLFLVICSVMVKNEYLMSKHNG